MFAPRVILHPTDFSDASRPAFRYALRLARRHDTALHLLCVSPTLGEDPIRGAFEIERDEAGFLERLQNAFHEKVDALLADEGMRPDGTPAEGASADENGAEGDTVDLTRSLRRGIAPGEEIVAYVDANAVDLVVMGTHGRRGVRRAVLGSVATEVVRESPCSVLTVRLGADDPDDVDPVLVPVDLSEYTAPLLRAAKDVTASFGASLDALHVVEPLPFPVPLVGAITLNDLIPDPTERASEHLDRMIERCGGLPVTVRSHVEEGHAAMTIVDVAEELGSGLIVIASHGLSALERALLGSVTSRVVRRAPCPVLVARVRPEPGAEEVEQVMRELLAARGPDATLCPSEIARAVYAPDAEGETGDDTGGETEEWRRLMPLVRSLAFQLARDGVLDVTQNGQRIDPETLDPDAPDAVSGPIRLGLRPEAVES